jgi:phosphatidylglycerophosphate synthase
VAFVVLSLAANWFGDSLDGTLARVRGHQRPRYGYYVDHVIDLCGATMLLAGLGCSGIVSPYIATGLLIAYLLVAGEAYLATHAAGRFGMSFLGIGPTELRILLALGAVKAAIDPFVSMGGVRVRLFDAGGIAAIAGLIVAFVTCAVRNGRALYAAEPLPREHRVSPPYRAAAGPEGLPS